MAVMAWRTDRTGRRTGAAALGVLGLVLGGCGAYPHQEEPSPPEAPDSSASASTATDDLGESDSPSSPEDASSVTPTRSPAASSDRLAPPAPSQTTPAAEPQPDLTAELISAYADALLLDLLSPGPSSAPPVATPFYEITYLEQICLEEGLPESSCRHRYGP
ncbi:MAG: hypothetical protein GY842_08605 [bacterium]|nr:hypothetical protein [bacterium]